MKNKRIRKYIITGVFALILVAAFLIYLFTNDSLLYISSISIDDQRGNIITLTESEDVDFYIDITKDANAFSKLPLEESAYRIVKVTYTKLSDLVYTYYLTSNPRNCFFKTPDGDLFNLPLAVGEKLLSRKEMFVAYQTAYPSLPTVKVGDKSYTPSVTAVTWKYKTADGTFATSPAVTPTKAATYNLTFPDQLDVVFPITPDHVEARVYKTNSSGTEIEVTGKEDFTSDALFRYVYTASWYEVPDCASYGQVEYTFYIQYTTIVSAALTPSSEDDPHIAEVSPGGTVFVRLFNAADKKITVSADGIAENPSFFGNDTTRYLLLPIKATTAEGSYPLAIQIGDFCIDMTINVAKRSYPTDGQLDPSRLDLTPDAYHTLFRSFLDSLPALSGETAATPLWSGNGFINPLGKDAKYSVSTRFHEKITLKGSNISYYHEAVDMTSSVADPSIFASSDGRVVFAGETEYGGNTVIIDHGLGLRTIYCHLSQINVLEGDGVAAGDILGKMGKTGFVTGRHLHFAAMVGNTFIDPLLLFETDGNGRPLYLGYFLGLE